MTEEQKKQWESMAPEGNISMWFRMLAEKEYEQKKDLS